MERGIRSLSFPSISTGAYGYPVKDAATVALRTVMDFLKVHREIRWGEIAVGLVNAAVGLLFYDWLEVTGPVLIGVGGLGALHGILWHSRRVEVKSRITHPTAGEITIYATRRKSGRKLIRMLRERISAASART